MTPQILLLEGQCKGLQDELHSERAARAAAEGLLESAHKFQCVYMQAFDIEEPWK